MYQITRLNDQKWLVECTIQDGVEHWHTDNKQEAIFSLIRAARAYNGSYIHESDIRFEENCPPLISTNQVSADDAKLLADIKRGAKKVLNHDHYLLRYNITKEEAETILQIREGRLGVTLL